MIDPKDYPFHVKWLGGIEEFEDYINSWKEAAPWDNENHIKEILDGDANIIASGIFGFTCSSLIYKMRHNKDGIDIQKLYKEIDKSFIKKLKKV